MPLFQSTSLIEWIIFAQIFLALMITNLLTLFYNRHLKHVNQQLIEDSRHTPPAIDPAPPPDAPLDPTPLDNMEDNGTDIIEVVGGEISENFNRCLEQTEQRLQLLDVQDAQLPDSASHEAIAAVLRFRFLEAEKLALPFSKEPNQLWNTLQPNYDKIIALLQSTPTKTSQENRDLSEIESTTIDSLSSQLETERTKNQHINDQLNGISEQWCELYPQLQSQYQIAIEGIIKDTPNDAPNKTALVDSLFNTILSLGSHISGENLIPVSSESLNTDKVPQDQEGEEKTTAEETDPAITAIEALDLEQNSIKGTLEG